MKHCELEGHHVVVLAKGGIWQLSVSFISKTRGRIFSFSDFSSVPREVHHQLKLLFCRTKFLSCVYVCETKPYRHISFLCTLLIVFHRTVPAWAFFLLFFGSLLMSWVASMQHSWWWAVEQGHVSSVSRECCQDLAVNLQPHLCLLSCLYAFTLASVKYYKKHFHGKSGHF